MLDHLRSTLLTKEAAALFAEEYRRAVADLAAVDPAPILCRKVDAETRIRNLLAAIEAGILTPTTKTALQKAESDRDQALAELAEAEQHQQATARGVDPAIIYADMVSTLHRLDDSASVRAAIKEISPKITVDRTRTKGGATIRFSAGYLAKLTQAEVCVENDGSGGRMLALSTERSDIELLDNMLSVLIKVN